MRAPEVAWPPKRCSPIREATPVAASELIPRISRMTIFGTNLPPVKPHDLGSSRCVPYGNWWTGDKLLELELPGHPQCFHDDAVVHLRLAARAVDEDDRNLSDAKPELLAAIAHLDLERV